MTKTRPTDINPETGRPFYETCDRCNYDRHLCPGCGDNLGHYELVCDECWREHYDKMREGYLP